VLEVLRYRVAPGDRAAFLAVMAEVRHVRGRTGAIDWQLFEDIAHPESWLEAWVMQDWAEHLREAGRLSPDDRATLAAAAAFQEDAERPTSRYLAVDPEEE
jgi:quinol monooxygenase YgiN